MTFGVKNRSFYSVSDTQHVGHPSEVRRERPGHLQTPVHKTKPFFGSILLLENKWVEHLLVNNKKNSPVTTQKKEYFNGMGYVRNFNPASVFTPPHDNCRETTGPCRMNGLGSPRRKEDDPKTYNLASLCLNSWADFFFAGADEWVQLQGVGCVVT